MQQQTRFVTASDGTRLAYATHGSGPWLVRAAHWLAHLQYDWDSPIWHPLLTDVGERFRMLRYDERGCGLSDWDTEDFSLDAWVSDLETVVDAAGLERFAITGMSQGAPVAITYAVRHPERVSALILFGGYLLGWRRRDLTDLQRQELEAMHTLMRIGWGRQNPVFRRLYSSQFVPDGDERLISSYDELMRRTTSPENAAKFEAAFGEIDVREIATQVRVPTLVAHLDNDRVIPFSAGRAIAAAIPGAEFVQLEGRNHIPRHDEPAWRQFLDAAEEFVRRHDPSTAAPRPRGRQTPLVREPLSSREIEVLSLVSRGLSNQEIAAELGLSVRTVERHLSNVYVKLDLTGKAARAAAAARLAESRTLAVDRA